MQAALSNQPFKHLANFFYAMKAIFVLNIKFKFSKMPLNVAMKLFDACVMPILIKGSEICLIQIL